jgi:predicted kinase
LIWESASELLHRSVDVVLDDGFFYREHRLRHVALAAGIGATTTIHYVNTPLEEVRTRLQRRNADLPRYNFHIDPATLDGFLSMIEPPRPDEAPHVVTIDR